MCPVCPPGAWVATKHCDDNREGTLFSWLHIYYVHLASVRFEHSVYHESLMTTHTHTDTYIYIHIYIIYIYYIYIYIYIHIYPSVLQLRAFELPTYC